MTTQTLLELTNTEKMMSCYLLIGDVQIPLSETFLGNEIHIPQSTFMDLTSRLGLKVSRSEHATAIYPHAFSANLNGTVIYMITNDEHVYE